MPADNTTKVSGVRAEPGGPVTITFTGGGLAVAPETRGARVARRAGWLVGVPGALLFLVVAVAAAAAGGSLSGHHGVQDAAYDVFFAALACIAIVLLVHAAEEALGYAVLAVAVIALPLLLVPGFRRWVGRGLRGAPAPDRPRNWIAPGRLGAVRVDRQGRAVAAQVSYLDGQQIRYLARGRSGRQLATEFERLSPLRTPHP